MALPKRRDPPSLQVGMNKRRSAWIVETPREAQINVSTPDLCCQSLVVQHEFHPKRTAATGSRRCWERGKAGQAHREATYLHHSTTWQAVPEINITGAETHLQYRATRGAPIRGHQLRRIPEFLQDHRFPTAHLPLSILNEGPLVCSAF